MLSFDSDTKYKLLSLSLFIRKLKLLLFPSISHFRESYYIVKNLHFNHIVMSIFESKWLTIVGLLSIRIAPTIWVHEICAMTDWFVTVKFILIFLYYWADHDSHEYPWTNVKSVQFDKYFSLRFTHICKTWPIHLFVSCF